jgi:hypothetical protein
MICENPRISGGGVWSLVRAAAPRRPWSGRSPASGELTGSFSGARAVLLGLAWSGADTVLSEQGQRVVDAGLESIAVTWDLAMPARRRQPAQESFARHCRCDRRLDRGKMVLLVVERLFIPDGFDLSRRRHRQIRHGDGFEFEIPLEQLWGFPAQGRVPGRCRCQQRNESPPSGIDFTSLGSG